ncbi:glycosyltransferase family 2 protein [Gammaproteobacteria bacterium]|nr:glycosyltransferase family 2 protein [Gammaproteobacteria bacterium]
MFSIILPLYNKAPYVEKTLLSIAKQNFKDFELIILNDGSTDESLETVQHYIQKNRVLKSLQEKGLLRVISQKNQGVSVTRNKGANLAKEDYLVFIDGDDWWKVDFLQELSLLIEKCPEAGIYGTSFSKVYKHKTIEADFNLPPDFESGYIDYCQLYTDNATEWMPLTSISVAIKKEVFLKCGEFPKNITMGEDFILWLTIALKYKVAFLSKSLAYYNQDIAFNKRSVDKLHIPQNNMIWNFSRFDKEARENPKVKRLLDILRARQLYKYYISKRYFNEAKKELAKIDWDNVPMKYKVPYKKNRWVARCIFNCKLVAKSILRK